VFQTPWFLDPEVKDGRRSLNHHRQGTTVQSYRLDGRAEPMAPRRMPTQWTDCTPVVEVPNGRSSI
jgi:hypothetical protein